ncbi:hypothetical protein BDZ88DRAFT_440519 [Geranomyces variabilis]|nr:hypothetical protein BDZ88DRAFT_440519 [Geranomyces variabilis]KAJ3136049.1 hypothetical protein HDU90_003451 [Geranomyces variabilis]
MCRRASSTSSSDLPSATTSDGAASWHHYSPDFNGEDRVNLITTTSSTALLADAAADAAAAAKVAISPPATPANITAVHNNNDDPSVSIQLQGEKRSRRNKTAAQLAILEPAFARNSKPTREARAQLAEEIGLSERSVQIWFQNKRAKVRNVGNDAPAAAETVDRPHRKRCHLKTRRNSPKRAQASQASQESQKRQQSPSPMPASSSRESSQDAAQPSIAEPDPVQCPTPQILAEFQSGTAAAAPPLSRYIPPTPQHAVPAFASPASLGPPPLNRQLASAAAASAFDPFNPFYPYHPALDVTRLSVDCIAIGTWHRLALSAIMDFYTEVDLYQAVIRTTFIEASCQLRMTSRLQHMASLRLDTNTSTTDESIASLTIEFIAPPLFEMLTETRTWVPCHDFTENAQALHCSTHTFQGPDADIRAELRALAAKSPVIYDVMYARSSTSSATVDCDATTLTSFRRHSMPMLPFSMGGGAAVGVAAATGQPASAATPWTLQYPSLVSLASAPSLHSLPSPSYPPQHPPASQPPSAQGGGGGGGRVLYLPIHPR